MSDPVICYVVLDGDKILSVSTTRQEANALKRENDDPDARLSVRRATIKVFNT